MAIAYLNRVLLCGIVESAPEYRSQANGKQVANFLLSTKEKWFKKSDCETKEKSETHRIAVFNEHLITSVGDQLKTGCHIIVEGQLETKRYKDSQGIDREAIDIVLRPYKGNITVISESESTA